MLQGPEGTSSGVAVFPEHTRGRVKNFLIFFKKSIDKQKILLYNKGVLKRKGKNKIL